jgi:hypothetical protein
MAALVGVVVLYASFSQHRSDLVEGWLLLVVALGVVLIRIYSIRIVVGDDSISKVEGFWSTQTVRFDEIDRSVARVMAEPSHPLWLDIYLKGQPQKGAVLRLPLKSCRQVDVSWLMSLEALRIRS